MIYRGVFLILSCLVLLFSSRNLLASQIPIGTADDSISCPEAERRTNDTTLPDDQVYVAQIRHIQCILKETNRKVEKVTNNMKNSGHIEMAEKLNKKKQVAITTYDPESNTILFDIMSLEQGEKVREACRKLAGGYAAAAIADPVSSTLAGVAGTYSCDAYFDAAVRSDPMLIAFPALVPGQKLTVEVFNATINNIAKLRNYFERHPQDAVFPTSPGAQGRLLEEAGKELGGDGGRVLRDTGKFIRQNLDPTNLF